MRTWLGAILALLCFVVTPTVQADEVSGVTVQADDVQLLKGKIRLEGTSDIVINTVDVSTWPSVTRPPLIGDLVSQAKLVLDGEAYCEVSSVFDNIGEIAFDNLDLTIEAGDTVEWEIHAFVLDLDIESGDPADTITVAFPEPSTALLLTFALPLATRRRHRQRR